MRDRGIINLDPCIFAKVFELPCSKLCSIVDDYIIVDAKPIHDLMDEFHWLGCCYRSHQLFFDPFGELVHCYEDVCETSFDFSKWIYQIQPPCRKWPGDWYGLQLTGWDMFLTSEILATFTAMN
jgi:hypothetical protein